MGKDYYQPSNNYERNFMMIKKFSGRITVLLIPVLFFISIVCSCYLNVIDQPPLEITILKVLTSKLNFNLELGSFETLFLMTKILFSGFCIFSLLYVFFKSKNTSFESNPDFGYSLIHKFSIVEMVLSAFGFLSMLAVTAVFMFGKTEQFEAIGAAFYMTVNDLKAYKLTIVILLILIDIILFLMIWFSQSQTDFMKSIRLSLVESVPKNKGAHTYGVFSMVFAIFFMAIAAFLTFMYYCYQDAFSGFGISLEKTYVCISLLLAYIKGLIPFILAVNAFSYSSMIDQINTIGSVVYNDYQVFGEAEDPNMSRRNKKL